jgi:hypothetical protein
MPLSSIGRALDFESRGYWFESSRGCQKGRFILIGNIDRWIGGGNIVMNNNVLVDTANSKNIILETSTEKTQRLGSGNTLNGNPFDITV